MISKTIKGNSRMTDVDKQIDKKIKELRERENIRREEYYKKYGEYPEEVSFSINISK